MLHDARNFHSKRAMWAEHRRSDMCFLPYWYHSDRHHWVARIVGCVCSIYCNQTFTGISLSGWYRAEDVHDQGRQGSKARRYLIALKHQALIVNCQLYKIWGATKLTCQVKRVLQAVAALAKTIAGEMRVATRQKFSKQAPLWTKNLAIVNWSE